MTYPELEKYCNYVLENGITNVKQTHTETIVTAPWVRLKCQYGCPDYGNSHCCPPHTPTPEQTRLILDSYTRALLFHIEAPYSQERSKRHRRLEKMLTDLEGAIFKDGFYKAFLFLAGPCRLCKECSKATGAPCILGNRARPSMEGCGIDVYQTVRNNGFPIETLREETDTQNDYCLMLVD